ncbi:MAG: hypothetical protein ACK5KL_00605 [Dysgonomonas sp.]
MKIHYFNPGHETAVLNASPYYMAPTNVVAMQKELAFLPAWYGKGNDLVLVDDKTNEYYKWLAYNFPNLPKPITVDELKGYDSAKVALWGISPQSVHYFEELKRGYATDITIAEWKEDFSYLNSRQAARDCLIKLIKQIPQLSSSIIPHFYTHLEDVSKAVDDSPYQLLAKAPYSSSGRGLLWLPVTGLTRTENQILHGIIKKQGSVSVEQVLNKQTDFAMEFMSDGKGKVDFVGYSLFQTNTKGGYESNYIGSPEDIESILSEKVSLSLINDVQEHLIKLLTEKYSSIYEGCIGVDMLIYRDDNEFKLQPCVEINMRYNMGYLAYYLSKNFVAANSKGKFYIDFNPKIGKTYINHLQMEKEYPLSLENNKIKCGYLPLVPITEESRYRAYILIDKVIT